MSEALRQKVSMCLSEIAIDGLPGFSLADIAMMAVEGNRLILRIELGIPGKALQTELEAQIHAVFKAHDIANYELDLVQNIPAVMPQNSQTSVTGVKNIIAVASGKGGVGKSTTAVNLALALSHAGASVGVLDADIYGPSQPQMLGVGDKRPEMYGPNMIEPIDAHGLKVISMGNLVTENTPMVWRGPMVSGALQQLLQNTHWVDIDYLIVDMPPGTGDIQLTLSQAVPVSGAVIVTTPQDIALLDARKGIEMFNKVNIPVFGVVENMATHVCSNCGHSEAIFGEEGGRKLAQEFGVQVLGQLPLLKAIRELTDAGKPPVIADPESETSLIYHKIARSVAAQIWLQCLQGLSTPEISVADD